MGMADAIASASMSMSQMQLETAYNTAMIKKSMESMEQQAMGLINAMVESVPAPSQYNFDVYA